MFNWKTVTAITLACCARAYAKQSPPPTIPTVPPTLEYSLANIIKPLTFQKANTAERFCFQQIPPQPNRDTLNTPRYDVGGSVLTQAELEVWQKCLTLEITKELTAE